MVSYRGGAQIFKEVPIFQLTVTFRRHLQSLFALLSLFSCQLELNAFISPLFQNYCILPKRKLGFPPRKIGSFLVFAYKLQPCRRIKIRRSEFFGGSLSYIRICVPFGYKLVQIHYFIEGQDTFHFATYAEAKPKFPIKPSSMLTLFLYPPFLAS